MKIFFMKEEVDMIATWAVQGIGRGFFFSLPLFQLIFADGMRGGFDQRENMGKY